VDAVTYAFDISNVKPLKWPTTAHLRGEITTLAISRHSINWAKYNQARAEAEIKAWITEHVGIMGWTVDFSKETGHHAVLRFDNETDAVLFRLTHLDIPLAK
jgi:hypothetical protein